MEFMWWAPQSVVDALAQLTLVVIHFFGVGVITFHEIEYYSLGPDGEPDEVA